MLKVSDDFLIFHSRKQSRFLSFSHKFLSKKMKLAKSAACTHSIRTRGAFCGRRRSSIMFTGNVPHGAFASSSSLLSKYYVKKEQLDDQIAERLGELSKRLKNWPTRR